MIKLARSVVRNYYFRAEDAEKDIFLYIIALAVHDSRFAILDTMI